jgi:hypothetical protein
MRSIVPRFTAAPEEIRPRACLVQIDVTAATMICGKVENNLDALHGRTSHACLA